MTRNSQGVAVFLLFFALMAVTAAGHRLRGRADGHAAAPSSNELRTGAEGAGRAGAGYVRSRYCSDLVSFLRAVPPPRRGRAILSP